MREGTSIEVSAADRARLEAVVADGNSRQKHVWRAKIILATADGLGTNAIMRRAGVSKPCVWRWQARFAAEGVDGLLRDRTRPSRVPPLPQAAIDRVITLTASDPPHEATHWTAAAMAAAAGISASSARRIWRAHKLQPHRVRTFKLSKDPAFVAKLRAIVGLYVAPPAHAVVLSVDEKPQIQALDRTQPGLPIKEGRPATMTHDYERHGTTTLFAALNVLDGTVLGRCMQRHRQQEFIRFLNAVEAAVPAGKLVHAILDNYATHNLSLRSIGIFGLVMDGRHIENKGLSGMIGAISAKKVWHTPRSKALATAGRHEASVGGRHRWMVGPASR